MPKTTAAKTIGFCAICERDIKLKDGRLVHHGYKRPGDGFIHGDCLCVHEEPYERTTAPLTTYQARLHVMLANARKHLEVVSSPDYTYFETVEIERRGYAGRDSISYTRSWSPCVTAPHGKYEYLRDGEPLLFERKVESKIDSAHGAIESLEREIARITKWIKNWQLKDVRVFEEKPKSATPRRRMSKAV